jgi:hypothetical protein
MIGIGQFVLIIVAIAAIGTIVAVLWIGAKENPGLHGDESAARRAWEERAKRVEAARQSLVPAEAGEAVLAGGSSGSSIVGTADEAEARRQAALARKAARAAKSPAAE